MNAQVEASKLKDAERAAAMYKVEERQRQNGNMLVRTLMPAFANAAGAAQRTQAHLRSAIVGLAAERYRLNNGGHWPRALDELVDAGYLKEIPRDPFDGNPLHWKRITTGAVAYSVGPDQLDNGGKLDRAGTRAPNTDIGFELWDRSLRGVAPPAVEEAPQ
jgi:hypothetical protein